jgi:hypothetical protein
MSEDIWQKILRERFERANSTESSKFEQIAKDFDLPVEPWFEEMEKYLDGATIEPPPKETTEKYQKWLTLLLEKMNAPRPDEPEDPLR